jgi:hypothetical protein
MPYVMLVLLPACLIVIGIFNYRRIRITARKLVEQYGDE